MEHLNRLFRVLIYLIITMSYSCDQDQQFETPELTIPELEIDGQIIDLDALYRLWQQELNQNGNQILTFEDSTGLHTFGYVVSSDEGGNFFEELIIQNAVSSPTRGVKVLLDVNPLYTAFELGRKVYIKLDGLTVGLSNGVLSLGVKNGNSIDKLAESQLADVIARGPEVVEIQSMEISISDITFEKTNLFVTLKDVQFVRNEVLGDSRKTFAAEPTDQFDGERLLEDCETASKVVLSTSTFADFKAVLLPTGRGNLEALLTMDFFGESFNLVVNDPSSIRFERDDRCDPDFYFCDQPSGGGPELFAENFEQSNSIEDYIALGWNLLDEGDGSTLFEIGNFDNNNYAQISGFNSGEASIRSWLILPAIDMDQTVEEELQFDVQASFDNGAKLSVLFSTDYSGDIAAANWIPLDASIPSGPADGFGDFQSIGPINIACIEGVVHFAFLYEGSDPEATTRYHIDNIKITGD